MTGVEEALANGPIVVRQDGVELRWEGGRLADVWMPTKYDSRPHAVECIDTGLYDFDAGELTRCPTKDDLVPLLARFMRDDYGTFWENA